MLYSKGSTTVDSAAVFLSLWRLRHPPLLLLLLCRSCCVFYASKRRSSATGQASATVLALEVAGSARARDLTSSSARSCMILVGGFRKLGSEVHPKGGVRSSLILVGVFSKGVLTSFAAVSPTYPSSYLCSGSL